MTGTVLSFVGNCIWSFLIGAGFAKICFHERRLNAWVGRLDKRHDQADARDKELEERAERLRVRHEDIVAMLDRNSALLVQLRDEYERLYGRSPFQKGPPS